LKFQMIKSKSSTNVKYQEYSFVFCDLTLICHLDFDICYFFCINYLGFFPSSISSQKRYNRYKNCRTDNRPENGNGMVVQKISDAEYLAEPRADEGADKTKNDTRQTTPSRISGKRGANGSAKCSNNKQYQKSEKIHESSMSDLFKKVFLFLHLCSSHVPGIALPSLSSPCRAVFYHSVP